MLNFEAQVEDSSTQRLTQSQIGRASDATGIAGLMVCVDLFAIATGFGLALLLAPFMRDIFMAVPEGVAPYPSRGLGEMLAMAALTVGIFAFGGLYRRSGWELDEIKRICAGIALVALFDATLQFVLRDHTSRLWFIAAYPLVAIGVVSFRMMFRSLPAVRNALTAYVVVLGSGRPPSDFMHELRESRSSPMKLLKSLPLDKLDGRNPQLLDRMLDRLALHAEVPSHRLVTILMPRVDEIERAELVIAMLNEVRRPYSVVLPFDGLASHGLSMQKVIGADMVIADMQPVGWASPALWLKRAFDLVATTLGLAAIAPVLIGLMGMLLFEQGPIFFAQSRVGRNGRRFNCLKFRTMRPDAQDRLADLLRTDPDARAEWERHQKLQIDPRVTPLGAFLRQTSLDELPQLFNVLMGDMSLVGPRPIIAPEVPGYHGDRAYFDNPEFRYYAQCTPGITGLWQVSGRASTTHDERIRLDRWYARNWSLWLDIMILFKTIRVVLGRQGSA